MKRPISYREAIHLQIKALQEVYDNAGCLRDHARSGGEKAAFNGVRQSLPSVWRFLQALDNGLPDSIAAAPVSGDYQLSITLDSI